MAFAVSFAGRRRCGLQPLLRAAILQEENENHRVTPDGERKRAEDSKLNFHKGGIQTQQGSLPFCMVMCISRDWWCDSHIYTALWRLHKV